MKKLYALTALLLCFFQAVASHIVGGEMTYQYLGPGGGSTSRYRIVLRLFRDNNCHLTNPNCAPMPQNVSIGIYSNDNRQQVVGPYNGYFLVARGTGSGLEVDKPDCITNAPNLNYHTASYTLEITLPDNQNGYTAAFQTCCRIAPLNNVINNIRPSGSDGVGSTYSCLIPGQNLLGGSHNSSPQFVTGLSIVCQGRPFTLDFSATDADGDSLFYYFCDAYDGGAAVDASYSTPAAPNSTTPPQYGSVEYFSGYSGAAPLGNATINSATGIITGIAPPIGRYVVCVCINEYREGKQIGYHRKDFILNVNDCDFAGARLQPTYTNCDSYNYTFQNENNSALNRTFYWDAGVAGTSTSAVPTFNFPDTGIYSVKLVINRGEPCSDSTTTQAKVFPGFTPDFTFAGVCTGKPTFFTDKTTARYGAVNSWAWDFGNITSSGDVSSVQNPEYAYPVSGPYKARLIVTSTKGCMDTAIKDIAILDKPLLSVKFSDTLICNGDALPLVASGTGTFSWTPAGNITGANTATPTVTPATTTQYTVLLDDNGCLNTATVNVRVVDFVTLQAPPDTTICTTDKAQLYVRSDGLRFEWSPAASLDNPNSSRPVAVPEATTTYKVTAHIGHCSATDSIQVTTVPYPIAVAGSDTSICYGTSARLNGYTTASSFNWFPAGTLSPLHSLTPVAFPTDTTAYILTATDTLGCPKPGRDTVTVIVFPDINAFAGRDTSVVAGQPLQFRASGGSTYWWVPGTALNRSDIPNPVAVYDGSTDAITYKLLVSQRFNEISCTDSAYVAVKVFTTLPQIFVPNAFTPNADGLNDLFRPIAVGMTRIEYFQVFNRWGQLVFSTSTNGRGWDGTIGGQKQSSGVYAWVVKGLDYTGKEFFQKGTVTLIR